jgi:hypothetical protein
MDAWQWFGGGLRSVSRFVSGTFWNPRPFADKTTITYDVARSLYRNDGADILLGAGFCRPIIDTTVSFMGIPEIASDDETLDADLNRSIHIHWAASLQEIWRNSMRDSKTWVRIWQPLLDDILTTDGERTACALMTIEPERIKNVIYNPRNPRQIEEITIVNFVEMPDPVQNVTDPPAAMTKRTKEHEVWEVVTPDLHRYYDRTDRQWLTSWEHGNTFGFVPFVEVFNEYDSSLSGGQSDFEAVYPFIKAFHEVSRQALQAHKYHSTPKLKIMVEDVQGFLLNNFKDVIDPDTGEAIPGAAINWKGREVLFVTTDEDVSFLEATSVLGDSKVLLEFLIDCISIASETPEWAFMRVEGGTSQGSLNAQTIPFEKKVNRKRTMFSEPLQMLIKMALVINGKTPERVRVIWPEIRVETLSAVAQAMQQLIMSFEVLLDRQLISDNTVREALKAFSVFSKMKDPAQEAIAAKSNFVLAPPTPPALPGLPGGTQKPKIPALSANGKQKKPALPVGG